MCENNHGHSNMTQTTTISLEVSDLVITMTVVGLAFQLKKNGVRFEATLTLLS